MTKREKKDHLAFVIAILIYLLANAFDYLLTVNTIKCMIAQEGNPIIRRYMLQFGVQNGLLFYKVLVCGGVIIGMEAIHLAYRRGITRYKAEYILYAGAILSALGGSLWLY